MGLIKRYNEIMGSKDERLEAEDCKIMKTSAIILLVGSTLSLYYAIMLNQVADVAGKPILTNLGLSLVPVQIPLIATILLSGIVAGVMQMRVGYVSARKRFAEVDRIPWDFVSLSALACGAIIGVLTCVMRILAEIQIVGIDNVMWLGDIAIGAVFFIMGFIIGFIVIALGINEAIKNRRKLESEILE